MSVHVFGIRHHGPGSARSLLAALNSLVPDLVLIEGPVEADDQIHWANHQDIQPPVALLVFQPDQPLSSSFYPFAAFSPEWNALRYALSRNIPARFIDLPKTHWMALEPPSEPDAAEPVEDPLHTIARLAGASDFESWWDRLVESRGDTEVFTAVHEAMAALRSDNARPESKLTLLREAAMRQQIRQAQKQGFQQIAVVCGAWHAPALTQPTPAKDDTALLKGLPKVKVETTWVPWTHGRLLSVSGYGAGVESPGWYEHLWLTPDKPIENWVAKVAHLLRAQDLDASPAQVVDTVLLANALASFRNRRHPSLSELNDATVAALLFGNPVPLHIIADKLIVGETLGQVPSEASHVPVQKDLEALQKSLRLKPDAFPKELDLDLRKDNDRERSQLLHRLKILGINWGVLSPVRGKLGTFHEVWTLKWAPEFAIDLIAAARWGNTVESAASAHTRHEATTATALPALTALLDPVLNANLPAAATALLTRLRAIAAVAPDVADLMAAIPPLARVARYGDVRQTDRGTVLGAITEMSARVCVGLPIACNSLSDEAAQAMIVRLVDLNAAFALLDDPALRDPWLATLRKVSDLPQGHALVSGRTARLLLDANQLSAEDISARASRALSAATDSLAAAAWVEGFLENSGAVLLFNDPLWTLVDSWLSSLPEEHFQNTLPLIRRTFATFAAAERRQLGEKAREGLAVTTTTQPTHLEIDPQRAAQALPLLTTILGLKTDSDHAH